MACYRPIEAWQPLGGGQVVFRELKDHLELKVPCGHCVGCHLDRSRAWAFRCLHEASLHEVNEFVTLTYDDDHLPELGSLDYSHFQQFMRRLRLAIGILDVTLWQWLPRYFVAGEYGEKNARPHFHALLFGCSFPDRVLHRTSNSGSPLYSSWLLKELWPHGEALTGAVTAESAAYVARYCMKKIPKGSSHAAFEKHYASRVPEMVRMSLKPGIGQQWYGKYWSDVYPDGRVVMRGGKSFRAPRYYDKLYERFNPRGFAELQCSRLENGAQFEAESSPERLAAREVCAKARLSFKRKSL